MSLNVEDSDVGVAIRWSTTEGDSGPIGRPSGVPLFLGVLGYQFTRSSAIDRNRCGGASLCKRSRFTFGYSRTECSRPTRALDLGNGLFKVLPTSRYDPEDEVWEFLPDSIVRVRQFEFEGKEFLRAVAR